MNSFNVTAFGKHGTTEEDWEGGGSVRESCGREGTTGHPIQFHDTSVLVEKSGCLEYVIRETTT
jgi:hypothetical protein